MRRAFGVGLLLFALASQARAQPSTSRDDRRVSFSWSRGAGAEDCSTQGELERRVESRLGRDPFASDAPRTLDARVSAKGRGRVAELTLRDRRGTTLGHRSFESSDASCASLEDAAVLAVALLIDPEAALAAPPPSSGAPAAAGATPQPKEEPRVVLVPVWIPVVVPTAPPPTTRTPSRRPVRVAASVPITVAVGPLPRAAMGTGLAIDVEPMRRAHAIASLSWLPEVETDDGDFSFSLIAAQLGACVDPWSRWRWSVGLCGGLRFGAIDAISHRLTPVEPGEQPWIQADLSARAMVQPVGPMLLGAEVGGGLVLLRPRFFVTGTDRLAFEPSILGASASIWAGVRFP